MTPKQRGLGRGLDALFEDEEATFAASGSTSANEGAETASVSSTGRKVVGIGQLTPNPDQPRTHFDPKAINDLAESIKIHGLLQPILVRPVPNKPDLFEIVAGERRWRASQKAQLHEVPIVIRDMDDSQVLQIGLIENLQRQDLNAIEESKGYQRLIDDFAFTADDVAQAVSKSRSHVANLIRLLQLPQSVQNFVVEGAITAGHARALLGADNPALMAQEVIRNRLSVRQTEQLAAKMAGRDIQRRDKTGKPRDATFKDPNIQALERDLENVLGMVVKINMVGDAAGQVSIAFRNMEQMDELMHRLSKIPKVMS